MTNEGNKTFARITNNDIIKEIKNLQKSVNANSKNNVIEHAEIQKHMLLTNGKVKLNRWIATTALSLISAVMTAAIIYVATIPK